jgi:hypothetical protein
MKYFHQVTPETVSFNIYGIEKRVDFEVLAMSGGWMRVVNSRRCDMMSEWL